MRVALKPLLLALCVSGMIVSPVMAGKSHHAKKKHHKKAAVVATQSVAKSDDKLSTGSNLTQASPVDLDVPGQSFVTSGPYVGVPIQYAGEDLIINSPSINTDLQLLKMRKGIRGKLVDMAGGDASKLPEHSHLMLSGNAEVQAFAKRESGGVGSTSDVNLSGSSIGAFFMGPSELTQGYIDLSYDDGASSDSAYRVNNSRVYVSKAFITIGDLSQSPFYATAGQYYVPFGKYSSVVLSDPLTKMIARTKARALTLGYAGESENGILASAFLFKGDSYTGSGGRVNNGGLNAQYHFGGEELSGDIGGGVMANLADSSGMQNGNGFKSAEHIASRVPAYDVRGALHVGKHVDLIAEYVTAGKRFNVNDMAFNDRGAKPHAVDLGAAYSFSILDNKPSSIGVAYGRSAEALSLGIPKQYAAIAFNTSLWRNTLQGLEFRHDMNYKKSDSGRGPATVSTTTNGPGTASNAITAQFDYYF